MSSALYVGPDGAPDKYRLVRSVGRGGEATLYLAEVTLAGETEPVVVKALNSEVAPTDEEFSELSRRWNEQAELLRFINRLGVVGVREHFEGAPEHPAGAAVDTPDRVLYLVMNYVAGLDLRDWRAEHAVEGPRGQREVLRHLEQIAEVLDWLHSGKATPSNRGVVHGDLSPGNIMISEEGQATLVDFGLSKITTRHMTARPWFTPGYAAPEVFNGEYSAATDRYAFGAIVYFALAGEEPPPTPEQLREAFIALPLLATADTRATRRIAAMFATDPTERPSAMEWLTTLRTVTTSVPWSTPGSGPAGPEPAASQPGQPSTPWTAPAGPSSGPLAPGSSPETSAGEEPTLPAGSPPPQLSSGGVGAPGADPRPPGPSAPPPIPPQGRSTPPPSGASSGAQPSGAHPPPPQAPPPQGPPLAGLPRSSPLPPARSTVHPGGPIPPVANRPTRPRPPPGEPSAVPPQRRRGRRPSGAVLEVAAAAPPVGDRAGRWGAGSRCWRCCAWSSVPPEPTT
ncbi:serine/threonine protein kinase [Salinactinospora qingdaonensis]|uniref:serine/threonine protein kinase n=1 Tax=Salinactinospora qingdaonensis TaxID=702744 RepID=UPI0031EE5809